MTTTTEPREPIEPREPFEPRERGELQKSTAASRDNATTPISDYYDNTLIDYNAWSTQGYLHFGYWRPWLNPFVRRPMLEEMNRFIFRHLRLEEISARAGGRIADLGCGVGAVSRFGSELYPALTFDAMTISPGQIAEAQRRHRDQKVQYHCGDYHQLPFPDVSLDGIFYLESLCHSTRPNEALGEAARCLKAGSRIVMTDGFIQRPLEETSPAFRYVVHAVADNWAVPMFHNIQQARSWSGRNDLKLVEEIECGWRLGPSALHAAHLSLFYFVKLLASRKVDSWQWKHLKASAFTIALGLYRRHFRYHMLAFEKITPRGDASS